MLRAVKDCCFVDFTRLNLPLGTAEIIALLQQKGFGVIDVDVVAEARAVVGRAKFRLGVRMSETPGEFDCSSFTKWAYGHKGVWLPRFAVQQFECGQAVALEELSPGDLIFTSGYCARAWSVGHVSLFTGSSVITAMIREKYSGVVEIPLETLLKERKLRGVRRVVFPSETARTIVVPARYEIETSDDVKYFVLSLIQN